MRRGQFSFWCGCMSGVHQVFYCAPISVSRFARIRAGKAGRARLDTVSNTRIGVKYCFLKVAAKCIAGSARFCCRLALFCAQVCHCQVWSSKHVPCNAEDTKNGFKPFFRVSFCVLRTVFVHFALGDSILFLTLSEISTDLRLNSGMTLEKSITERFCHALIFEALAIAICAPLGAWLLGYPLMHIGLLTLMVSLVAMVWNMLFNAGFDQAQRRIGFERNLVARTVHAVLFEIGLIVAIVPLAAWWLGISWWRALVLDIGIALFFLPYSFAFNWAYDNLRTRLLARRQAQAMLVAATAESSSASALNPSR